MASADEIGVIKAPRAPRRHQVEVDEARRQRNELRAEMRRLRREVQIARKVLRHADRAYVGEMFSKALDEMDAVRDGQG